MGVIYSDGMTPTLAPAFDVVGYSAYNKRMGHALALLNPDDSQDQARLKFKPSEKPSLTPALVRLFCAQVGLQETLAHKALRDCAAKAFKAWPVMIQASALTATQKAKLLSHFNSHPWIVQLAKVAASRAASKVPTGPEVSAPAKN